MKPERLYYFDRWITPAFEKRRYDTQFYLCRASMNSSASGEHREIDRAVWTRPEEALRMHAAGELSLFPPTWVTLSWLSSFANLDDALEAAKRRRVVPVEPHFMRKSNVVCSIMPGHPEHPYRLEGAPDFALFLCEGSWSYSAERQDHAFPQNEAGNALDSADE